MWQPTDWPRPERIGVPTSPTTTVGRMLDFLQTHTHTLFYQVYYLTAHICIQTLCTKFTHVRQLCKTTCNLLLCPLSLRGCSSLLADYGQFYKVFSSCNITLYKVFLYTHVEFDTLSLYVLLSLFTHSTHY